MGYNSLTCDGDGVFYAIGQGLATYDTKSGQFAFKGKFNNLLASGDCTFRQGKLYFVTVSSSIVEVDLEDPFQSKELFTIPDPAPNTSYYGIVSVVQDCDNTDTYASGGFQAHGFYKIDFATGQATLVCQTPNIINGAATSLEFLASDCAIRLDLDADDNSGALGKNYKIPVSCGLPALGLLVCDTADIELKIGNFRMDSVQVEVLPPVGNLVLSATAVGQVSVGNQNSPKITLIGNPSAAFSAVNPDFRESLRTVRLKGSGTVAAGIYQVAVYLFGSGDRRDTAFATIEILEKPSAGTDTLVGFCQKSPAVALNDFLSTDASPLGNWSPAASFDPKTVGYATFNYIVAVPGCPEDTAVLTATVWPLPQFSLGADTVFCGNMGFPFALNAPGPAAIWSNGTTGATLTAHQAGLFWAEIADANGCRWRDSILIKQANAPVNNLTKQLCRGQSFQWNGQVFTNDTVLCQVFPLPNGCDSTDCLDLSFFYENKNLDSAICAGQSIFWNGQNLAQPGIYADTIPIAGCLTIRAMSLTVAPSPVFSIKGDSVVCADKTGLLTAEPATAAQFIWSNGESGSSVSVSQTGIFSVTATNAAGCTTVKSQLFTVQPPIETNWETKPPTCFSFENGEISLTNLTGAVAPVFYEINGGSASPNPDFAQLPAGIYEIKTTDALGCTRLDTLELAAPPPFSVSVGPDFSLESGQSYQIPLSVNPAGMFTFAWQPPVGLDCSDCPQPVATPSDSVTYQVVVTDENGCAASDELTIRVLSAVKIAAPNAFTPDGDGVNDFFTLFIDPKTAAEIQLLRIFDRWGELVFEKKDLEINEESAGWDGMFRGKTSPMDIYVWTARIKLWSGGFLEMKGDLTLIR